MLRCPRERRRHCARAPAGRAPARVAVVGEVARLQHPDRVVVLRAVDEHHQGLAGHERLAAGVGEGVGRSCDVERSSMRPASARASGRRSGRRDPRVRSTAARFLRRCRPRAAPASSIRKWVVDAGWITSDRASPTLARCENTSSALDETAAAGRSTLRSKLNTAPQPRGSSRLASSWSGCDRQVRVGDLARPVLALQEAGDLARVVDVARHAQRQRLDPLQDLERVHRAHAGAEVAQALAPGPQQERRRRCDSSAKTMPWKPS